MLVKQSDAPYYIAFSRRLCKALSTAGHPLDPHYIQRELKRLDPHFAVTVLAIRHWLSGQTMPRNHNLKMIATWLNVSPCALTCEAHVASAIQFQNSHPEIPDHVAQMVNDFLGLLPFQQQAVQKVIHAMKFKNSYEFKKVSP